MADLHVITGGAGFIGVNLAHALLERGLRVLLVDNLSRGRREYVDLLPYPERRTFVAADLANPAEVSRIFEVISDAPNVEVWHLCANSDIPAGVNDPSVDLRDTFLTTYELLRTMTKARILQLNFSSTSAVYGDHGETLLTEETYVEPISNYGAMKLASEAAIRAWCEACGGRANVFRFPNVVGVPATHGVIFDFIQKLQKNPDTLAVLGDGSQRKAYLHVADLVSAMLFIHENAQTGYNLFNIGPADAGITVRDIAKQVRDLISPRATIEYGNENRGWIGDVPRFRYSVDKLRQLGWSTPHTSAEAIALAVKQITAQQLAPRTR